MEQPVSLKKKPQGKKKETARHSGGRVCIIHFASTVEEAVTPLTNESFSKITKTAQKRLTFADAKQKLSEISGNIPAEFDATVHGYHRRCYQLFTLLPKAGKRKISATAADEEKPSTSKRGRPSSAASSATYSALFPADKCLFCDRKVVKLNQTKHTLVKCVTSTAEASIKAAAEAKGDEKLLCKVRDQDLIAREAWYHNCCRKNYTRSTKRHTTKEDSESSQEKAAHNAAFQHICRYMEEIILKGGNIERLSMIRERYLKFLLDNYPKFYNENYKTYKLKDKLCKHFGKRLAFWQPRKRAELVYAADIEGEAVEAAFELAGSDERRLIECAAIIRRHIIECRLVSEPMPWPPSATWLLSNQRRPPEILLTFLIYLITGKPAKHASLKSQRCAQSFAEDLCYASTNGDWLMPKHVTLPMTVRHLTGSAEVITILNRYGHGQSYSRTLELETAMCNSVTSSVSVLPQSISTVNNAVIHLCYDNFDLDEETPSGSGTTHSTHGIVIQELRDPDWQEDVAETDTVPKSKDRSVKHTEVEIRPCYAKPKVEPNLTIDTSTLDYSFKGKEFGNFTWLVSREIGGSMESQTVPSWAGWLSQTAAQATCPVSKVEYMAPLNESINENSTVQYILEQSIKASTEVDQEYAIVTFDLAVAKKAYALVWQYTEQFSKVIVRMGVFHTICSLFGTVGKMMKGSGFSEIVIESGICASGSLDRVMSGKHFNRAVRVHKLMFESLERLLLSRFEQDHPRAECLSEETFTLLKQLIDTPCKETLNTVEQSEEFKAYFEKYNMFKSEVLSGDHGKTAQFWAKYMHVVEMILILIRATKENDLDLHIAALHALCPMFFAYDHTNYARYVPVYIMTLMNLDVTHPVCKKLLEQNGFSVSRSSVPLSRNAVDITIEQTINRHAKSQGGIIGFSRNYAAYYRWCITRHLRAQYVEATLQRTEMSSDEVSSHKDLRPAQKQKSEDDVKRVIDAISGFTNPFSSDVDGNSLYCLSSGIPAKPEIEKDLLEATAIGQTAMKEFINTRLVEKSVAFHDPVKRNKLKTFAACEVKKKVTSSQNKISQIRAERNIFGQLVLLSIEHDVDLELTLSFPLGPVPWSLATADGMPVKTDKSKLLHYLELGIVPTAERPSDAVHIIEGNAMLQSLVAIPDTFEELAESVFNQLPKAKRVDFITDTYKPQSIKSYERTRRGTTATHLLSGAKTRTPHDWKNFMSNDKNKTQLIKLLLDQWKTDKFATRLVGRDIYFVIDKAVVRLTSEDGQTISAYPEETLFSSQEEADTRIVLHCLHVSNALPDAGAIMVRSPDTDVLVLLVKYCNKIHLPILFDTGTGNKRRLLNVNDILKNKGEDICSVLPALHCFTGCDTTSAFVRRGKVAPVKLVEKSHKFLPVLNRVGQDRDCSEELVNDMEAFTCAMYGHATYTNVNKLRYDMFLKKYQPHSNALNVSNGMDMSLLPPCRSALEMHVRRVNYQVYVWIHSHENNPDLPELDQSGWTINEDAIEYVWVKGNLIVPEQLIDILCDQQREVEDEENENDDAELEFTSMIDEVYEDESDGE